MTADPAFRSDDHEPTSDFDPERRAFLLDEFGPEILAELDDVFWNGVPELMEKLHWAIANADRTACDGLLHTIAGSSANLGYAAVSRAAGRQRALYKLGSPIDAAPIAAALDGARALRART